jgi:hypothetical protein
MLIFLVTLFIVGGIGIFASYYARGYRLNLKTFQFQPNGILVIKSEPDGASVYVNGELKTATNATISLPPGTYDVEIKKDGFFNWYKRLTIEKEIVSQTTASLFKSVPSLSPVTSFGASNPVSSADGTKIAFSVLPTGGVGSDKTGLWVLDTFTLPLGFSSGPKRITDGDMTEATYSFSPDGRQILLTISSSVSLIDSGSFTAQGQRINIASKKEATLAAWEAERAAKNQNTIKNLPTEVSDLLLRRSLSFTPSSDETMVLYTASSSASLPDNLIKTLPGASTQKQERNIQPGYTYVYDIKEDRNFLISDQPVSGVLRWMPGSKLLLWAQEGQIIIMDYDGTNRQIVYSGSYTAPYAFPSSNSTKLLILTNLGAALSSPNLYTLTVK